MNKFLLILFNICFLIIKLTTSVPVENLNQDTSQKIPDDIDPLSTIEFYRNARDSYGNLLNPSLSNKNNNNNNNNNNKKTVEANGILFEIPSYASGITEIKPPTNELLPPLSIEQQKENAEKPSIDLLPPYYPNNSNFSNQNKNNIDEQTPIIYTENYDYNDDQTEPPTLSGPHDSISSQQPQQSQNTNSKIPDNSVTSFRNNQLPETSVVPFLTSSSTQNSNDDLKPKNIFNNPFISPVIDKYNKVSSPLPSFASTSVSPNNINKDKNNNQKYIGGFGGSPGILGDQKQPGYAVKPDGTIKDPDTIHHHQHENVNNNNNQNINNSNNNNNNNNKRKYTGGFGGPPGVLTPFDNNQVKRH